MPDRPAMLNLMDLRARGWGPTMVERLLGQPDRLVPNPRYRSAAPMRLYAVERVEAAEATPEFQAARAAAARRSAATTRVMDGKRAELREMTQARPVPVPKLG
jgi:hypothetical protein